MSYNDHKLTDEEIELIVSKVCDNLEKKLYLNIGKGLLGMVWKTILIGLIAIAAYGAGMHFWK